MSETPDKIPGEPELSEAELKKLFPVAAKYLTETTISDFIKGMLLQWAGKNPNVKNMLWGIFSGLPMVDLEVPEWVKRASRKFFGGICLKEALPDETADWVTWMEALGYGFGMIEDLLQNPNPASVTYAHKKKVLAPMMGELKMFASNSKAEESAAFFSSRLKGERSRESADQMTVPTKICMLIAMYWEEVSSLKSTSQLHGVLMETTTGDGKPMFPANVDSRETRRICKEIGLQFNNSWNKEKPKI